MYRKLGMAALLAAVLGTSGAAQNTAATVLANASKAMGVDQLTSITYSGSAQNGAFGQSKVITQPLGAADLTKITAYTRTINFGAAPNAMAIPGPDTGRFPVVTSIRKTPIYSTRPYASCARNVRSTSTAFSCRKSSPWQWPAAKAAA